MEAVPTGVGEGVGEGDGCGDGCGEAAPRGRGGGHRVRRGGLYFAWYPKRPLLTQNLMHFKALHSL